MDSAIIEDNTTAKVADLIKINIPKDKLKSYSDQLNTVLESVSVLNELDTENVLPSSQTHGLKNVWQEDTATPGLDMSKYKNTRNFKNGYFVVKKVFKK